MGERRRSGMLLSLALLLGLAPRVANAHEPRVAFEVRGDAATPDARGLTARLKEMLLARLAEEGFRVVLPDADPDVILTLSLAPPDCLLRATLPTESITRGIPTCSVLGADDRLELVQKATELVRSAVRRPVVVVSPPAPPPPRAHEVPSPGRMPVVIASTAPPEANPASWELSTGVDLRFRSTQVVPAARLGVRVSVGRGWGLHLTTSLSDVSNDRLAVTEGNVLVGLGRRLLERERLRVDVTATAGQLIHHFRDASSDSGTRFDVLGVLALTATVPLSRHLGLELRIAPGLSRTEYMHLAPDGVIWSGRRFRVDVGAGIVLF